MMQRRSFIRSAFASVSAFLLPRAAKPAPDAVCAALKAQSVEMNEGFAILSNDIIENRRRISKLQSLAGETELRVWALEDHTMEEEMARLVKMQRDWNPAAIEAKLRRPITET